jgi:hypothetical protein
VEFLKGDRSIVRERLDLCWHRRFEALPQIRSFPSYKGQPNFPGDWWFASTGQLVAFESWVKRDAVMCLDYDLQVTSLACEPFRLRWNDGSPADVIPHYFGRLADGTAAVIDVRGGDPVRPAAVAALSALRAACAAAGWQFRRVEPLSPALCRNLRWLHRRAHPRYGSPEVSDALVQVFSRPTPLLAGARQVGEPMAVLPTLYHAMWRQVLTANLAAGPLGQHTLVRLGPGSAR